jgi:ribonuclease D
LTELREDASVPDIVVTESELALLTAHALSKSRVGIDIESNGRFAYRGRIATVQVATEDGIFVIDPIAPGIAGDLSTFAPVLCAAGPVKVIHDVGFDARLLAEQGIRLGNVHDTALLASWLGRKATGLASLFASELGLPLDKSLQAQDWAARPLTPVSLEYLKEDVRHLFALDDRLWSEALSLGITEEVTVETEYRIASAERSIREPDPRPLFSRVKGAERLGRVELAVLRRLCLAREEQAKRLDAPAGELVQSGVLLAIAKAKPTSRAALPAIRSPFLRAGSSEVLEALLAAVTLGVSDAEPPPEEMTWLDGPKLDVGALKARREREARLSTWRKAEALRRGVNEQVVLPGHCVTEIATRDVKTPEDLALVAGFGDARALRYGADILAALAPPP